MKRVLLCVALIAFTGCGPDHNLDLSEIGVGKPIDKEAFREESEIDIEDGIKEAKAPPSLQEKQAPKPNQESLDEENNDKAPSETNDDYQDSKNQSKELKDSKKEDTEEVSAWWRKSGFFFSKNSKDQALDLKNSRPPKGKQADLADNGLDSIAKISSKAFPLAPMGTEIYHQPKVK